MSKISQLYDRILNYLKDVHSGKERNDLEREMAGDAFSEEAFEGLTMLKGEELETDMNLLNARLDNRISRKRRLIASPVWRIAAAVVLISGLITVLFFVLKAPEKELLTQEAKQEKSNIPETLVPPAQGSAVSSEPEDTNEEMNLSEITPAQQRRSSVIQYDPQEEDAIVSNKTIEESESMPQAAEYKKEQVAEMDEISHDSLMMESGYITGRILGVNRKALPGVSLTEEGTGLMAKTDREGNFRMKVSNSNSTIEVSHSGYQDMAISSREIAGKEISLNETESPTEEIIVLSLNDKSARETSPRTAEKANTRKRSVDSFSHPLPPGGSMKKFETWVESRIDTVQLKQLLPGNYKIRVRLTVFSDGKVGNISVPEDIPPVASQEYIKAVSLSDRWQPAIVGNLPVDSDIIIEFSLTVR